MTLIGYARVSTASQTTDLQEDALHSAGISTIFKDIISGSTTERPQLNECLKYLRKGDTLIVWKLDRLGRSLKHLIALIQEFEEKGIHFKSLQESIDTSSSSGKLIFHLFCALAEFERNLISERVRSGIESARKRGRKGGRPEVMTREQAEKAYRLLNSGNASPKELMTMFNVKKTSLYKYIKQIETTSKRV